MPRGWPSSRSALVVGAVQWWVIAVAPELVVTLFGAQWAPAVVPLQLVCVGSLALAPTRILRSLLLAAGLPGTAMRAVIGGVISLFVGFGVLTTLAGLAGAGAAFAVASAIALGLHVRGSRAVVAFPWIGLLRVNALGMVAGGAAWLVIGATGGGIGLVASGVVHLAVLGALASFVERDTIAWLRETWLSTRRRPSSSQCRRRRMGMPGARATVPSRTRRGSGPGLSSLTRHGRSPSRNSHLEPPSSSRVPRTAGAARGVVTGTPREGREGHCEQARRMICLTRARFRVRPARAPAGLSLLEPARRMVPGHRPKAGAMTNLPGLALAALLGALVLVGLFVAWRRPFLGLGVLAAGMAAHNVAIMALVRMGTPAPLIRGVQAWKEAVLTLLVVIVIDVQVRRRWRTKAGARGWIASSIGS